MLAAVGLHLLGCLLIGRALRAPRAPQPAGPAMVWIGWPDSGAAKTLPPQPHQPHARIPPAAMATAPVPVHSVPLLPAAPGPARPATNWRMEAERAAAAVINRSAADQQRDGVMGAIPKSPFRTSSARPAFPWSRQPLGKHFDADPHTGIVSLRGKRCTLAFFLILPGFGCALGPLDPDPGRGDLFDPKYQPHPLELPDSLATAH
jgi:hypothetical protein